MVFPRWKTFFPVDPVAELGEVQLSSEQRYLLLSDLHLGDGGRTDLFEGKDRALCAMLAACAPRVDAVILAGDVLDAPQAGTATRIMRAHRSVLDQLEALAQTKPVYLIVGNHDSVSFARRLLSSVRLCRAVHLGDHALVVHGHELDVHFRGPLDGRGQLSLRAHALVEQLTGQLIRLPFGDHDNLTNRFAHWLFYRLTMADYHLARLRAALGDDRRLRDWAAHHDFWARSQWGDSSAMLIPALAALARGRHGVLIAGHCHQAGVLERIALPISERVSGEPLVSWRTEERRAPDPLRLAQRVYANLGSWTLGEATYGIWQGPRPGAGSSIQVRDWVRDEQVGDRTYQLALTAPQVPGMREWWQRYYRGFLRYDGEMVRRDRAWIAPGPAEEVAG